MAAASARTHSIATSPLPNRACPTPFPNSLLARAVGYGAFCSRTAASNPSWRAGSLGSSVLSILGGVSGGRRMNDSYFGATLGLGMLKFRLTNPLSTIREISRFPLPPSSFANSASSIPVFF